MMVEEHYAPMSAHHGSLAIYYEVVDKADWFKRRTVRGVVDDLKRTMPEPAQTANMLRRAHYLNCHTRAARVGRYRQERAP